MKRIGFMMVYNEVDWVAYAIDQAVMLCDELVVCEGSQFVAFPHIPERSNDGTLDIIEDKKKEYPELIRVMNTTRKHSNYRTNQCDNFNEALDKCNVGDYFICLDVDVFYEDSFIDDLNDVMREGKVDIVKAHGANFAFGFKWKRSDEWGEIDFFNHEAIYRKIHGAHFVPTHQPRGFGHNIIVDEGESIFHYTWVKPKERMRIRMETSGFHPGMLKWFNNSWDDIKLVENNLWRNHLGGVFNLIKYDGDHPSILDNHPWRNVEDVREI